MIIKFYHLISKANNKIQNNPILGGGMSKIKIAGILSINILLFIIKIGTVSHRNF